MPEHTKEQLVKIAGNPTPNEKEKVIQAEVAEAQSVYERRSKGEVVPFRPRSVCTKTTSGFEVYFDVAFIPEAVLDKALDCTAKDVPDLHLETITSPSGETITGALCLTEGVPTNIFFHRAKWFSRTEHVLKEDFMAPEDQLHEKQGLSTVNHLYRSRESGLGKTVKYDRAKDETPTWSKLEHLAKSAKIAQTAKDKQVKAFMQTLNPSSAVTNAIVQVSSGSRFSNFQVQHTALGASVAAVTAGHGTASSAGGSSGNKGSAASRPRSTAVSPAPKRAKGASSVAPVPVKAEVTPLKAAKAERSAEEASPASVKLGGIASHLCGG
jgi:hypothetical protein